MHVVFCNNDILTEITPLLPKPSLAALSRTCKTIKDPALDQLWRHMESLIPLCKCLPQDVWSMDTTGRLASASLKKHVCHIDLISAIQVYHGTDNETIDWSTVQDYAKRMKVLSLSYDEAVKVSALMQTWRTSALPGEVLLPHMRELSINVSARWHFEVSGYMDLLVTVSAILHHDLRSLKASLYDAHAINVFMTLLECRSPHLETIFISSPIDPSPMCANFSHLQVINLQSGASTTLSSATLEVVGSLPRLETLISNLKFQSTSASTKPLLRNSVSLFPVLKELQMTHVVDLSALTRFIQSISSSDLSSLTVHYVLKASNGQLEERGSIMQFALALNGYSSLRSLTLHCAQLPQNIPFVAIRSLSQLTNLRTLKLFNVASLDSITNDSLRCITHTLSNLEILSVLTTTAPSSKLKLSGTFLRMISTSCPLLRDLTLTINLATLPWERSLVTNDPPRRTIPLRFTIDCPLRDIEGTVWQLKLAEYLSDIYTDITIHPLPSLDDRLAPAIETLNKCIRLISGIRSAEKQRSVNEMTEVSKLEQSLNSFSLSVSLL